MADFNQDDGRERAMVAALNLDQRPDRSRHDEDAHLDVTVQGRSHRLLFELKSTPANSDFGTGRDTGTRQLLRWSEMHFVFGWFPPRDNRPLRMWYGSPAMMRGWIAAELDYIAPDLRLLTLVPALVGEDVVDAVLGSKDVYDFEDMKRLMKAQWNTDRASGRGNLYRERADLATGERPSELRYSRTAALSAVQDRIRYLLARGGTVNNRKISARYVVENCTELHPPQWARGLEEAVHACLSAEPGG